MRDALRTQWAKRGQQRFTFQPSAYDVADVVRGMAIESGQVVVITRSNGGPKVRILDAWGNEQIVYKSTLVRF